MQKVVKVWYDDSKKSQGDCGTGLILELEDGTRLEANSTDFIEPFSIVDYTTKEEERPVEERNEDVACDCCDEPSVQTEPENKLHYTDNDTLVSQMTLADRQGNVLSFIELRREVMYRLRCAQPLVNWTKPDRFER